MPPDGFPALPRPAARAQVLGPEDFAFGHRVLVTGAAQLSPALIDLEGPHVLAISPEGPWAVPLDWAVGSPTPTDLMLALLELPVRHPTATSIVHGFMLRRWGPAIHLDDVCTVMTPPARELLREICVDGGFDRMTLLHQSPPLLVLRRMWPAHLLAPAVRPRDAPLDHAAP